MSRIVIVGTEGALGQRLARLYAALGNSVAEVALTPGQSLDALVVGIGSEPIDLVIFADDVAPPVTPVASATRTDLGASLYRLTYVPFRLAALLKPALAAGHGKLVLLSRDGARMTSAADGAGRYLERPLRAAAHALWRCLSVEWREAGIEVVLVAVEASADEASLARLTETIAAAHSDEPADLIDSEGQQLSW